MSPTTISRMVKGEAVSIAIISKICMESGMDIGDLICIERILRKINKWHLL